MKLFFRMEVVLLALLTPSIAQVASHQPTGMKTMMSATGSGGNAASVVPGFQVVGKPVVRINGVELTDRDLMREMLQMFPYARVHNGFPKAQEPEIRRGALSMIEFEELVYQEAQRRKMDIPVATVNRGVAAYRKKFESDEQFRQYLKEEMGGSMQQLRKQVRRSLLIDALLKAEILQKSVVTVAEAHDFYQKNIRAFSYGDTISLQTISIMPAADASPEVKQKARKRAEEILKQAKATKSYEEFGLLAEKVSEDDFRVDMGDHKAVPSDKLPDEVVRAAKTMRPGQVSDLIQAGSFYFCFRLNAHETGGRTTFAQARTRLLSDLRKTKSNELRKKLDAQLRSRAKVEEL
jgi:parvulin-like peptidyl-prolyl isomerase